MRRKIKIKGTDVRRPSHSDQMQRAFGRINGKGKSDLPGKVEIKETRSGFYHMIPKDKTAKKFIFYDHRTQEYSLVKGGKIPVNGSSRSVRPAQVKKVRYYSSKSPRAIRNKLGMKKIK